MRKSVISIILLISLLSAMHITTQAQTSVTTGKQWDVKYEAGSQAMVKGTKIKMAIGQDSINCQVEKREPFSIPVSGIKEISYDTKVRRRLAEGAAVMSMSIVGGLIVMSLKSTKHYIGVVYEEGGQEREAIFEVGKSDRAALLDELQRLTGKQWRDLVKEQKETLAALEREKKNKIPLQLDRAVRMNGVDFKSGMYQAVLLRQSEQKGTLHFFAGKDVNPKKSLVSVDVEIRSNAEGATTAPKAVYAESSSVVAISEIHTATQTLRLKNR